MNNTSTVMPPSHKFLIAILFFCCAFLWLDIMTGIALWRAPQGPGWIPSLQPTDSFIPPMNDTKYAAVLPDIGFDLIPYIDHDVATTMLVPLMGLSFVACLWSESRWEIFTRFLMIDAMMLFMRGVTIVATSMNNPYPPCYNCGQDSCSDSLWTSIWFSVSKFPFFDCGDLMFSGHTVHFMLVALLWSKYGPSSILTAFVWAYTVPGILALIACRIHYTNDILIAIFLVTFVWHWYHLTLVHYSSLERSSPVTKRVMVKPFLFTRFILWTEAVYNNKFFPSILGDEQHESVTPYHLMYPTTVSEYQPSVNEMMITNNSVMYNPPQVVSSVTNIIPSHNSFQQQLQPALPDASNPVYVQYPYPQLIYPPHSH